MVNPNIKYICFTDNKKLKSDIWEIKIIEGKLSPRKESRRYKILSHKYIDSDISLYVDGSCRIVKDPYPYIEEALKKSSYLIRKHNVRGCIYGEGKACIKSKKDNPKIVNEQLARYRKEEYPRNNGLTDNTVILRKMNPEIIKVENDWWKEVERGSARDQLSFCYAAWKNNFKYGIFRWKDFIIKERHRK